MISKYDRKVDALAIRLRAGKSARTVHATDDISVDLDADGRAVSIEILNASAHVDPNALAQAAPAGALLSLAEAGRESGLSPSTLRGQIHKGKLKGEKRGRDWVVDATSLENYLEAVESRGQRADTPKPTSRARQTAAARPRQKRSSA